MSSQSRIKIGWAEADITPTQHPIQIAGQFYIRLSEGIKSPLKSTALVLDTDQDQVIFISVDTAGIPDKLRDDVREKIHQAIPEITPTKVLLNATHTHAAPAIRNVSGECAYRGVFTPMNDFEFYSEHSAEYLEFLISTLANMAIEAWNKRAPGGIAYGQDFAVVGRNRRWVTHDGIGIMYGLNETTAESFNHIEGYEDHSLNLLATYDSDDQLTGVMVNIPSPSQEHEHLYEISADYWHETRAELRARFGEKLYILPQCSAAGDLTPHLIYEKKSYQRMLELREEDECAAIAQRIADGVNRVLPYINKAIIHSPQLIHQCETLQLPANVLSEEDAKKAQEKATSLLQEYEREKQHILDHPEVQNQSRWYRNVSRAFRAAQWNLGVVKRYQRQSQGNLQSLPAEVHTLRLGDIAFATNPFELYLDYAVRVKVRSAALQTFIIQLAGAGTYVPSQRGAAVGGYGALPASNPIGYEGGNQLAEYMVNTINSFWTTESSNGL